MNDELISILGLFSQELLGDERFKSLCELFGQQCASDMLTTKPQDTTGRERIHAAYVGFGDFIALIEKFAETHRKLTEQPQTDGPPQDTGVQDIYGLD